MKSRKTYPWRTLLRFRATPRRTFSLTYWPPPCWSWRVGSDPLGIIFADLGPLSFALIPDIEIESGWYDDA